MAKGKRRASAEPTRQRPVRSLRRLGDRITDGLGPQAVRSRGRALARALGITRSGQVVLVGCVLTWVLGRVVAGTAMYLFAYGALLLVVAAYFLAPRRLRLDGVRDGLYPRVQQGDRLEIRLQLTAKRRLSTFVIEERLPERLGRNVKLPINKLAKGATVEHLYGLRAQRRGSYQIGPLVAVAGDPLGLAQRETVVAESFELLVHPRVDVVSDRPLTRAFEEPPTRPPVSKPWPSGLEFFGMREYALGDDLRRIVWRASARTGTLMVREAEQGITDKVIFLLDTDRGAHSKDGEGLSESFETAVRSVASLGVKHLVDGYEVRVETNGGPLTRALRGSTQQIPLLDVLARIEVSRDSLSQALTRLVADPRRDAHYVIVTPHLGTREAAQLKLLTASGCSVMVVALLWDEQSADSMGRAAALGCQVNGVRPGQDLSSALASDLRMVSFA